MWCRSQQLVVTACSAMLKVTHRTARMHAAASMGLRFHRMNGSSVEYKMPNTRLPTSVSSSGVDPTATPIASAAAPVEGTQCLLGAQQQRFVKRQWPCSVVANLPLIHCALLWALSSDLTPGGTVHV